MSPPKREKTLASIYSLNLERLSRKRSLRSDVKDSASVNNKRVASDIVKREAEEEGDEGEGDNNEGNNISGNAMVKVKLEMQDEPGLLVTCGIQKRKRLSRGAKSNISFEVQKCKQPVSVSRGSRWPIERINFAEQTLAEVLKENEATLERPVSRSQLRVIARKQIGDTGLLDHSLKHIDGKVTPGGDERFRRCYNTDGTMEYWLESADLVKIKLESGIPDPNWVAPSWFKVQTATHESSAVSSKLLMGEIEKMKSDIEELAAKQKLPDRAEETEKLHKDLMSWKVQTDKQIAEISKSLSSTQCMFKEMISWKDKVEKQLVGISTSLKNLQANGSTSFSSAPESWKHMLQSGSFEDFRDFEPWDDLIDGLPEAVRPDTYSLLPNPCTDLTLYEEQSLPNIETQRTERDESRSSDQDKAELTPGSSMTAGPKSDIDDQSQETLKELVTWKGKAEQQLTEISNAVLVLQGQNQPTWRY